MSLATGQITIVDLNDALTLQGYLSSDKPLVQMVDANSAVLQYSPSWVASNINVKASLYALGTATDLLASSIPTSIVGIKWFYKLGVNEETCMFKQAYNSSSVFSGDADVATLPSGITFPTDGRGFKISNNFLTDTQTSLTFRCVMYYQQGALPPIPYSFPITFYATVTGSNSYTVVLTNEAQSIACNSAGTALAGELGPGGKATSNIMVYKGATQLTQVAEGVTPTVGQFKYVLGTPVNCTSARTDDDTFYIKTISESADSGSCPITVYLESSSRTVTKTMSFTKVKSGVAGAAAKQVSISGQQVVKYTTNSTTPNPASLKITAIKNSAVSGTSYVWEYSSDDGASWATAVGLTGVAIALNGNNSNLTITSSTFASYSPTSNSVMFRVTIDTVTDIFTVYKVLDGATPVNMTMWTPGGNTFKNSYGINNALQIRTETFEGMEDVSSTATYRWLYQDTTIDGSTTVLTATTGGTTIKGTTVTGSAFAANQEIAIMNGTTEIFRTIIVSVSSNNLTVKDTLPNLSVGWTVKALGYIFITANIANRISGFNTATLGVYRDFVNSMAVLKCISIYKNKSYYATTPIYDITDPYAITIHSSAGDKFKNKVGNSNLTCNVFQNGLAIDDVGTKFTYTWTMTDKVGTPVSSFVPKPVSTPGTALSGITATQSSPGTALVITGTNAAFVANKFYYFGAETTPRKVVAIGAGTATLDIATTVALGSAIAIKPAASYKTIIVSSSDVTDLGTFFCSIS